MDFHSEILETYRSFDGWIQLVWLVAPLAFIATMTGLLLHHRRWKLRRSLIPAGKPIYAMSRMNDGEVRVFLYAPDPIELDQGKVRAFIAERRAGAREGGVV